MDSRQRARERVYEDFEPTIEWERGSAADMLKVYLPGFKKEQLKVQLTTTRFLRISGERQLGENTWSRFRKEIPIPSNYDIDQIGAKFENGILLIKHPKIIIPHRDLQPHVEAPKPSQQKPRDSSKPPNPQPPPPSAVADSSKPPQKKPRDSSPKTPQPQPPPPSAPADSSKPPKPQPSPSAAPADSSKPPQEKPRDSPKPPEPQPSPSAAPVDSFKPQNSLPPLEKEKPSQPEVLAEAAQKIGIDSKSDNKLKDKQENDLTKSEMQKEKSDAAETVKQQNHGDSLEDHAGNRGIIAGTYNFIKDMIKELKNPRKFMDPVMAVLLLVLLRLYNMIINVVRFFKKI